MTLFGVRRIVFPYRKYKSETAIQNYSAKQLFWKILENSCKTDMMASDLKL